MKDVINMNLRHITNFGGLSVQGVPIGGGAPERTYFVSPNFALNDQAHQSPTIQGAIDMAYSDWGVVTDTSHVPIILVYPGKYTEQIHLYKNYHIQGFTHEVYTGRKTAVLYNTGADADHYPLRGDDGDEYYIEGINIEVDDGGVIGKLGDIQFVEVHFRYGDFIESTRDDNSYTKFQNCLFWRAGFNLTGVTTNGRRTIGMDSCWLYDYTWTTTSTHNDNAKFWIDDCVFNRSFPDLGGDWFMQMLNSHVFGDTRTQINTPGDLTILDSVISNGLHFVTDPANVKIHSCGFDDGEGYPIVGEDITADVAITNVSYVQNTQKNGINGRIQTIGDVVNVGGDSVNRYYSIQDAIDSLPTGGIVSLAPGTYTEQIHSTANVHIQGRTHEGVPKVKATVLYNTGADAAHYPLGGDDTDVFTISDITIKTEPGAVIGKLSASNFTGVVFENGHFIEATANQAMLLGLADCSFENSMAFNLTGAGSGGLRAMTIIGCYFNDHPTHWVMDSTHASTLVIVKNTIFHNFYPDVGGNWKVEYSNSHCFGTSRSVISTTNRIAYIQCILSNGLHFTSDPDVIIQLCTFNDDCGYAITGADITATGNVTDVNYVGNIQQNGICGSIQLQGAERNVGGNAVNRYFNLEAAMDSIVTSGIVTLYEDSNDTIETWSYATDIVINGQGVYSITQDADISIPANGDLEFQQIKVISGHSLWVHGTNGILKLTDCPHATFTVHFEGEGGGGSQFYMYNSSLYAYSIGSTVNYYAGMYTEILYSYLFSSGDFPAVMFNVAHTNFKTKYTSYVVSGGDGAPTVNAIASAEVACVIDAYNCGSNMPITDAEYVSNSITVNGCIVDNSLNF